MASGLLRQEQDARHNESRQNGASTVAAERKAAMIDWIVEQMAQDRWFLQNKFDSFFVCHQFKQTSEPLFFPPRTAKLRPIVPSRFTHSTEAYVCH
jgi:hypothetical protein